MIDQVVSKQCRQDKKRACYHLPRNLSFSEYKLESESSTGSVLPLYTSPSPSLPPPLSSPSPIDSPSPYNNMSQINLHEIIRQQQEQLAVMQVQIQALLTGGVGGEEEAAREVERGGTEVAKP